MLKQTSYTTLPSTFGRLAIIWQGSEKGPQVQRILLPNRQIPAEKAARMTFVGTSALEHLALRELAEQLQSFLKGGEVTFDLGIISLDRCSDFQRSVLLAEANIPRGWVSTYGRLASYVGTPRGARAVGGALAHNPFPIIIPCHRTIRSDGWLGGFGGGLKLKQTLLQLEGIEFSTTGKVIMDRIYY